jgi:hypothetical protein
MAMRAKSMGHTGLEKLRLSLRHYFIPRRHSVLLVAIIAAFAIRPLIGDNSVAPLFFSIALLVVLLVALCAIQVDELIGERDALMAERRKRSAIGWTLAAVATVERLTTVFAPSHTLYVAGSASWLIFLAYITWTELRTLLRQKEVTRETISLSISVYLLMGLAWGLLYIFMYYRQPQSFSFPSAQAPLAGSPSDQHVSVFPVLIYFSLTTLTTIGYGDVTPLTLQARYAAVAEGVAGQFYLAILVARLVGMQMSQSASRHSGQRTHNADTGDSTR